MRREIAISLILAILPLAANTKADEIEARPRLSLNGKKGQIVTVFAEPGKTWRDCKNIESGKSPCVGWPVVDPETALYYIEKKTVDGELFYKVDVTYNPKNHEVKTVKNAWIRANRVEWPEPRTVLHKKPEELSEYGKCLISGDRKFRKFKNPFQKYVVGYWKESSDPQALAIDALARTLFGEMRGCAHKDTRYMKAVARVALNRAYYVKENGAKASSPFVINRRLKADEMSIEQILPYVLGSPKQFSMWNRWDKNLDNALCPKRFRVERETWNKALEIAREAILDREEFLAKTEGVKTFHFTSGMNAPWNGFVKADGHVDGQALSSKACVRLWQKKKVRS